MKSKITLQERLKDLRVEKGLTLKQLSEETGLSSSALGEYEINESKGIPHQALVTLADFYDVSLDYLFDRTEVRNLAGREISDLGLSDEVLDVLSSKKLNNRLLGEIICHPNFKNFMANIEIYVDGIASQGIHALNAYTNILRKKITGEFEAKDTDPEMIMLDACIVEEERYFINKLEMDIEPIAKDIREAHKKDEETATDTTVTDRVNEIFDDIEKSHGNFMKVLIGTFCRESGIYIDSLTPIEVQVLEGLFSRGKNYKKALATSKNNRKKK
ncbi:helix-turn-helix domain-containing protein [Butyrivibrio sp. INlla14]|uniref:helix-turn-helix domain-containing protein n=1 Tax=Butyrivibrio sp. INlla14 TaxID=1520808 RepID=UPI000875F648|nr:helix-turn-helix transcriptional regulator [Butyrivibrio sp. INlla14]SCX96660.1 Helix-turn-helix domain-containing protein [Butyrivibrio sp. INlla14]